MGWRATFIAAIAALVLAAPAQAADYTVTGTGDPGGTCEGTTCTTLRAALAAAEQTTELDVISVPAGVITVSTEFVVNSQIRIVGAGARATIIDGGGVSRGFWVTTAGVLQLANLTVRNGVSGGGRQFDGGGIYNAGSMLLTDMRVTGNRTIQGGRGGGIANNRGYLVADNLLVDGNVADNGGGGIHNFGGPESPDRGWMLLTDTTIFNNSSGLGGVGGLASTGTSAVVSLTRSTIADNRAGSRGIGGILPSGTTQVTGSILARNSAGDAVVNCDVERRPTDGGFNVEDDTDCGLGPALDPALAPELRDEGGDVDVLPVGPGSAALSRVPRENAACTGSDQRGLSRPQGAACEAGAYEVPVSVVITSGPDGTTAAPTAAFTFSASEATTECRLDGPGGAGTYEACESPKVFSALAPGAYVFFVRATDAAGNRSESRREFTVLPAQLQPGPAPGPQPPPAQTPTPTPVPNRTVVVAPKAGTVLVKLKGQSAFAPLDVTKGIPNGSEVDVRKGRVTLTSIPRPGAPPQSADFYGGMFVVNQKGGITDLKLSERLTGCPKGQRARASVAQKKVTKRRLWGNGKGSFRTTGRHSSATVRGTVWLVEDKCTTTLTRVTQGVVQVNDFVKKRKALVKKGKRYTARAKRR